MAEDNKEQITKEELEQLNKDLDSAKSNIVSNEVTKKIEEAKEEAKKEAEKEFITNQRIKDIEEEKKQLQSKQEEAEKKAAEEIEALKTKVNEMISSKSSISQEDPFSKEGGNADSSIESLSDEDTDAIEKRSMDMFLSRRIRKD